ncbi:MAG: metallohydrolase [Cenarchaeum symbiont of Oopsacas minuta]|nr:metallohydrolase [Cenarchaeum symbiont of Oopsacas minuta]
MIVQQMLVGQMQNFTYIVYDKDTRDCIIIDPSWDLEKIIKFIECESLKPIYIVNTHHHFDHTVGNEKLAKATDTKIIQHVKSQLPHEISVSDGDEIKFGHSTLRVLHTPGHSKDSICLVGDGKIFSGDTLFVESCGRVDLEGGSASEMYDSIFDILYGLDEQLLLYPGHDYGSEKTSTIGDQKRTNPVMRKIPKADFVTMMGQ